MCFALLLGALAPRAEAQKPDDPWPEVEAMLKKFEPAKSVPKDDALRKLLKERYNAALNEVSFRLQRVQAGTETPDELIPAARRLVESGLELNDKPADQLALLEKDVVLTKYLEKITRARLDAGVKQFTPADVFAVTYMRADAEIRLLRFKEKMKGDKK